ncbi:MAG TPA: protein-methionine-sulfoxide reductase catalytic subunit MsrP [Azospirillaceae bacterium]|nr:protein-methionine-sulfoxide reductase catalytic subunit MsrP [Azospirillaceae bacterium]
MLVRRKRGWERPESEATPESVYRGRRAILRGLAAGGLVGGLAGGGLVGGARPAHAVFGWGRNEQAAPATPDPTADLYPAKRNASYALDRPVTDESQATTYNNFYEFGSHKQIWRTAQRMEVRPWTVTIDGMVENPITLDFDQLVRRMPLEERLYRFRCVEAWAMAVPWSGFPLASLVELARPLSSATYLEMATFGSDRIPPSVATGLRQNWYPWPYVEGLSLDEATNELAFIATGLYGKPIPDQNGAPLRLVVPWKYGFKSVKSIVRFTFTDKRPATFWERIQASEYGFWANVNPDVPHPRWSQAQERMLGTGEMRPTQIFNGYGEFVANLYKDRQGERLYV